MRAGIRLPASVRFRAVKRKPLIASDYTAVPLTASELPLVALSQPLSRTGSAEFCRRAANIDSSLTGDSNQNCWRLHEFSGHDSSVPELGEIIAVTSHLTSFCCKPEFDSGMAVQVELFMASMS